jgi:hypothetical protein
VPQAGYFGKKQEPLRMYQGFTKYDKRDIVDAKGDYNG